MNKPVIHESNLLNSSSGGSKGLIANEVLLPLTPWTPPGDLLRAPPDDLPIDHFGAGPQGGPNRSTPKSGTNLLMSIAKRDQSVKVARLNGEAISL